MEDDSKLGGLIKWGLGTLGLGGIAAVITVPGQFRLQVALAIIVLFLLLFGGYYLWRRARARRRSRMFSSAIEAQTAAAPKSISDPNQRAALDKLRQKFQTGLQEFRSRGKDIYKLPWYVIIGESGSGKTEAIRHSGVEFPPGLQDELQGSGGTVNMDWWFTNRAIILDTAGAMLFRETQAGNSPEWSEFLRLLKKSRPLCPINGLFLVLSIESLIKDSADRIAEKASKLAQQLDLIQRTMDVRFPVYLVVTKADLLTGFREFFDNIDDPLLQHQMFGWSNPDPLDSAFRPDLIEQHLKSVADRLRRRRLALLLRESPSSSPGRLGDTAFFSASAQPLGGSRPAPPRRLDEMDALFALPESVMRLVPRLRRYLETVFVAGEWSSKPVFLRGIYFTSSMREGKALDEAMALATGLSVDQLPEDRTWDKNRAFFLRDLFVEKVFRENGLVTRATNTIQLLRKRQLAIFGTAGVALLLLVVLAWTGYGKLAGTVGRESAEWRAGAGNWNQGVWSPAIVSPGKDDPFHFTYAGTDAAITVGHRSLSAVQYHQRLKEVASRELGVSWIFKPFEWMGVGKVYERKPAQRTLLEQGVLRPLVDETRKKMLARNLEPGNSKAVQLHREAMLSLIQLQTDQFSTNRGYLAGTNAAARYLHSFVSYLTDSDLPLTETNLVNLAEVLAWTYSKGGSGGGAWPPKYLLGPDSLSNNPAIQKGLEEVRKANQINERRIETVELQALNGFADELQPYRMLEGEWLNNPADRCGALVDKLSPALGRIQERQRALADAVDLSKPLTNLTEAYRQLANASAKASALSFGSLTSGLTDASKTDPNGLVSEIRKKMSEFNRDSAKVVTVAQDSRNSFLSDLDSNFLAVATGGSIPAYEQRSSLYVGACKLASEPAEPDQDSLGDEWKRYERLATNATAFRKELSEYAGPSSKLVRTACEQIAGQAEQQLKEGYVNKYVELAIATLKKVSTEACHFSDVVNARLLFDKVEKDLQAAPGKLGEQVAKMSNVKGALASARLNTVRNYALCVSRSRRAQLKFPILLDSPDLMDERSLKEARRALEDLAAQLADKIWAAFPNGEEFRAPLATNIYARVISGLITGDTMNEVSLFFILPGPASIGSNPFTGTLRYVKGFVNGKEIFNQDLPRLLKDDPPLAKLPINAGISLEFFSDVDRQTKTATFEGEAWMLPRLIQKGDAERIDGKETDWKLKLKLRMTADQSVQTVEGFIIRLNPNNPLPRKEDWPTTQRP